MKILPINKEALIYNRLNYAYLMSIIDTVPQLKPWVMENYYELYAIKHAYDTVRIDLNYYDACDYADVGSLWRVIQSQAYSQETLKAYDIEQFIKRLIDENKYVVIFVDEYYLPNAQLGGYTHFLHEELIYGYNEDTFFALGMDKTRHYNSIEHKVSDLVNAYKMGDECRIHGNLNWAKKNRVICFDVPNRLGDYPLNLASVINKLKSYTQGEMSPQKAFYIQENLEDKIYYGDSFFDVMIEEIENRADLSFRYLHHLCEYVRLLDLRMGFFEQKYSINCRKSREAFLVDVVMPLEKCRIDLMVLEKRYKSSCEKETNVKRIKRICNLICDVRKSLRVYIKNLEIALEAVYSNEAD